MPPQQRHPLLWSVLILVVVVGQTKLAPGLIQMHLAIMSMVLDVVGLLEAVILLKQLCVVDNSIRIRIRINMNTFLDFLDEIYYTIQTLIYGRLRPRYGAD